MRKDKVNFIERRGISRKILSFIRTKLIRILRLNIAEIYKNNAKLYSTSNTALSLAFAHLFYKKQTLWLQPGCFLIFRQVQP